MEVLAQLWSAFYLLLNLKRHLYRLSPQTTVGYGRTTAIPPCCSRRIFTAAITITCTTTIITEIIVKFVYSRMHSSLQILHSDKIDLFQQIHRIRAQLFRRPRDSLDVDWHHSVIVKPSTVRNVRRAILRHRGVARRWANVAYQPTRVHPSLCSVVGLSVCSCVCLSVCTAVSILLLFVFVTVSRAHRTVSGVAWLLYSRCRLWRQAIEESFKV